MNGWPVPWVSPKHDLAQMDPDRVAEIKADLLCQVCGQGHKPDDTVYLVCNGAIEGTSLDADMKTKVVLSMDQSILHKHCCQMSIALCPRLKKIKAEGALIIVSALHKDISVWEADNKDDPDGEQVGVEGSKATLIGDTL